MKGAQCRNSWGTKPIDCVDDIVLKFQAYSRTMMVLIQRREYNLGMRSIVP